MPITMPRVKPKEPQIEPWEKPIEKPDEKPTPERRLDPFRPPAPAPGTEPEKAIFRKLALKKLLERK
ncbi:hypothetical protein HY989_05265 [Candidatus Micrarchaeota archaeon]|nr:hypothetical protein [Candidatus Micrarchaeota archaeon]